MNTTGQIPGMSFAWMPDSRELVVASSALVRIVGIPNRSETKIADLHDDGDPLFPPKISVSPDGNRVAFTCRRTDENRSRVWVATVNDGRWSSDLLSEYAGAFQFISPFWSPDSRTLGLHAVSLNLGISEIKIFPDMSGTGETVYRNHLLNPDHEPSFMRSGEGIIFYHTPRPRHGHTKAGPSQLALLTLHGSRPTGMQFLTEPSETDGWFRWSGPRHLVINDAGTARLVDLPALDDRPVPP